MKYLPILFLLFPFILPAQTWDITEIGTVPEGVSNNAVAAATIDDTVWLYSFSGIDNSKSSGGIHGKAWRFNTETGVTETLPNLPGGFGKIAAKASRIGNIIYIIGGYRVLSNGSEITSPAIHRFDVDANAYLVDGTETPIPVDDHVQAIWRDSLIFLVTGWSNTTNVPNVQVYTPNTDSWQAATSIPNNNNYKSFGASGTIIGDTIFYFGGASATFPSGNPFPIQQWIRKGVINPNNPADISWSIMATNPNSVGYRTAATQVNDQIFWIGGSEITYNFDGRAYSNGQVVSPANRSLGFEPSTGELTSEFFPSIPMDLQSLGEESDSVKYIWGGMVENRLVSNKILKLVRTPLVSIAETNPVMMNLQVFPNPSQDIITVTRSDQFTGPITLTLVSSNGQEIQNYLQTQSTQQFELPKGQKGLFFLIAKEHNQPISVPFPLIIN